MLGEECDFPGGIVPKAPVKRRRRGRQPGVVAMLTLLDRGHEVTL